MPYCVQRTAHEQFEAQRRELPDPGPQPHLFTSRRRIRGGAWSLLCSWCGVHQH